MQYVVIRERVRAYCHYHIIPAPQYYEEREDGCWRHHSYETVELFDSLEEAEEYVKEKTDFYVLFHCLKSGFQGYDICHYLDAENVYCQPSIYDIIYTGSYEECKQLLKELEKE